jgi:hypothetical protein
MTDYKATPEQWVNLERRQLGGNDLVCAALELRARVEALEANHPEKPDSSGPVDSLVERLAKAIYGPSNTQEGWRNEARAAIREVAAWLSRESEDHLGSGAHWAKRLQREAER